ncbi:MAG: FecR domain-containing protein [bacterium]|nr:FecR domain-containing protein [bacterium]
MSSEEVKKKLEEGTLSHKEWENLDNEIKSQEEIQFLWLMNNSTDLMTPAGAKSKEEAWESFDETLEAREDSKPVRKIGAYLGITSGIAAAIAVVVWWAFFKLTTFTTTTGEILSLDLPDGSKAIINANSEISYNVFNFKRDRSIEQKGEIFYEVEPGDAFVVETENTLIEVLGTSFNVIEREENTIVACKTGKVKVTSSGNDVTLTAGLKTTLKNELLSSPAKTREGDFERMDGKFSFQNEPFEKILIEVKRQFGLNIEISKELRKQRYTGGFTNQDVDIALQQLCKPMGLKFRIKNDTIYIYK